jgi:glycosyltransferase involved in cell wall biosynthesis
MRIAYVTTYDVSNISTWTKTDYKLGNWGAGYHLGKALENQSISLDYIGIVDKRNEYFITKVKGKLYYKLAYYKLYKKVYASWSEPIVIRDYASQISRQLSSFNSDMVLAIENESILPLAYLECKQPIVVWTDTSIAGLIDFYSSPYNNFCFETKRNIYAMEKAGLERCQLVIFSSDWAAKTAIQAYGIEPSKVKVVPWGANLECNRTDDDIKSIVEFRSRNICKLLFIGVAWYRKGGDIAIEVAKELNKMGLNTELSIVGIQQIPTNEPIPNFIKNIGFVNKYKTEGLNKMNKLFCESHFLIMPSRAESYGHVFCEANSFGLPCLTTNVGGIPSIIRDDLNGKTFPLNASISEYCNYIFSLMTNYQEYKRLAYSSFNEYQSRLNWTVAVQTGKQLIRDLV